MKSLFYPLVVLFIAFSLPGCNTPREDAIAALSSKGITPEELDDLDARFADYEEFEHNYRGGEISEWFETFPGGAIYENIARRLGEDDSPFVREWIVKALSLHATTFWWNREPGAVAIYEEIDRRFGKDPGLRQWVAMALYDKSLALEYDSPRDNLKAGNQAEIAVYEEVDRRFGEDASPAVRKWVITALLGKAGILWRQKAEDAAFAIYDEIDRRFGKDDSPIVRDRIAMMLYNKGWFLQDRGKYDAAIAVYDEIDRRFGKDNFPAIHKWIVMALRDKARIKKADAAIAIYEDIERRFCKKRFPNVSRFSDVSELVAEVRREKNRLKRKRKIN
jgi:tetratricopeptide (TPR) repeat protein